MGCWRLVGPACGNLQQQYTQEPKGVVVPNIELSETELKATIWGLATAIERGKIAIGEGKQPAAPDWDALNAVFERFKELFERANKI